MKIAHISDIHLDSQRNPNCLAEIEELIQRVFDKGYDHLVITGDVVDVANYDDLWALREIFKRNGALHWERVTIIPGNHDVFGKYEFTSNGVGATASRALQSTGLNFAKKLHEFCDIFRETITEEPEITTYFPFVKVLSGGKNGVALVSFSSVLEWSVRHNPVGSRGYIHAEQRHAATQKEVLDALNGRFNIALFHHAYRIFEPKTAADAAFIWSMELIERESFLNTMKKLNVKIALHGHYHKAEVYAIDGIAFMNSGSVRDARTKINSIVIHDDDAYSQEFVKV
ncbi:MAG: metallophosphoesterase [Chloroherpetonaceae bacterium]|nr:metallophosphoesterase [Chloroherpetonaceae bacterium]MDW8438426.1 metallophosphoesterase [Chloroherpetonaceae bacterium]